MRLLNILPKDGLASSFFQTLKPNLPLSYSVTPVSVQKEAPPQVASSFCTMQGAVLHLLVLFSICNVLALVALEERSNCFPKARTSRSGPGKQSDTDSENLQLRRERRMN